MRKLTLWIATLALVAGACGSDPTTASRPDGAVTTTAAAETTSTPPETTEPTTTTAAPATTEAPASEHPQRIVSLSPTGTEMLFAIGAGDQVVAVDSFSYHPPEAPVTDLSAFEPNVEAIATYEPDLVVLDFDPGDLVNGLEAIGIPTVVVPAAATFEDIYDEIALLGEVTGNEAGAEELIASMRADITAAVAAHEPRDAPLTYYHEIDTTLFSLTSDTFAGQVYGLFGLENIADAEDADGSAFGYPQLSEEYILEADPDLIFLADVLYEGQSLETVASRPGWDTLTAVRTGNVIELNDDIVSRWGPRVVDYVQAVSAALAALEAG